ncbi:hypothetical protein NIES3974_42390 [Calothrix sp. NIES-3974]|nr:hypothetical protein NIES3974_42390 [Calothrix sp. NIES-3974]
MRLINSVKWTGKILYYLLITTLIASCYPNPTKSNQNQKPEDNNLEANQSVSNLVYQDIIEKPQLEVLIFPVGISPDINSQNSIPLLSSRQTEKNNNIYNLIFYHKTTDKSHLLLNKKAIINSFELIEIKTSNQEQPSPTKKYWLYRIIDKDTNNDGKLTPEDAVIGYISTGDGKNLVQVTPDNTQMKSWKLIPDMNAVLIFVTYDSNSDKQFNSSDRTAYIRVNLEKPELGQDMFNRELEQKMRGILEK